MDLPETVNNQSSQPSAYELLTIRGINKASIVQVSCATSDILGSDKPTPHLIIRLLTFLLTLSHPPQLWFHAPQCPSTRLMMRNFLRAISGMVKGVCFCRPHCRLAVGPRSLNGPITSLRCCVPYSNCVRLLQVHSHPDRADSAVFPIPSAGIQCPHCLLCPRCGCLSRSKWRTYPSFQYSPAISICKISKKQTRMPFQSWLI